MPYIEKMVMRGFKSFASETAIPFENGMNTIVGSNGSGKSNIADAICFVLGRMSIKSMRAAKAANLIFSGTKAHKPVSEAMVKIIFNNSDKKFSIDAEKVEIQRIARRNGQGIYRINGETKTRNEVLELLAQAGIDPYGFNIMLQGEIAEIIRINPEGRRKIIEEVAGISVYETRKERSLRELEKTEEKLKEINAILRERTAYLRNLEEERLQALRFKKLEENQKKFKASIIYRNIEVKEKEVKRVNEEIEKNMKIKEKLKEKIARIQESIRKKEEEVAGINKYTQESSGIEMEELHNRISDYRAEMAGATVRKDNSEMKLDEVQRRKGRTEEQLKVYEKEVAELKKKSPIVAERLRELEDKKAELADVEAKRKKMYGVRNEINFLKERIKDKQVQSLRLKNDIEFSLREVDRLAGGLLDKDVESCRSRIERLQRDIEAKQKELFDAENSRLGLEKNISIWESEVTASKKIKEKVSKLDICPLCKTKITEEHINEVYNECDRKISESQKNIDEKGSLAKEKIVLCGKLKVGINSLKEGLESARIELVKLENVNEKKERVKKSYSDEKVIGKELEELNKKLKSFESDYRNLDIIEDSYEKLLRDIEDVSARTEENLDMEIRYKQKELDKLRDIIKQAIRDEEELEAEILELGESLENTSSELENNEKKERELQAKFKKLFDKRTSLQMVIQEEVKDSLEVKNELDRNDENTNNFKIDKAKLDAEIESLRAEFKEFEGVEIIKLSINELQERLQKTSEELAQVTMGGVNLRALEVYEDMKKQYEEVALKSETLTKEKEEILKIIEEIDKKKKKTFIKTLEAVNEIFRRNFMQLSTKGEAYLKLENQEDPFAGGLNIVIKIARGKYFDVASLSGGEKTLVALSLIFAIQEYKPYSFYIFDEVDAALDKRNSEKLASLVKKHMKSGQYIIVTHNDAIITESSLLYGVSMQDGVSKILSLKI